MFLLISALVGGFVVFHIVSNKKETTDAENGATTLTSSTAFPPSMHNVAPEDMSVFIRDNLDPWFIWATTADDGPCKATGSTSLATDYSNQVVEYTGHIDTNGFACGYGTAVRQRDGW